MVSATFHSTPISNYQIHPEEYIIIAGFPIRRPFRSFPNPGFATESFDTMPRRVSCGELRIQHIGALVELAGSVQEKRLGRFLLLRDAHGSTQLVLPDEV